MTRARLAFLFMAMNIYTPSSHPGEITGAVYHAYPQGNMTCLCVTHPVTEGVTKLKTSPEELIFSCIMETGQGMKLGVSSLIQTAASSWEVQQGDYLTKKLCLLLEKRVESLNNP